MGLFDKLKAAVQKTRDILRTDVRDLFKAGVILDEEKLEEFHRGLIHTDMGVVAAKALVDEIRAKCGGRTVQPSEIWDTVRHKLIYQLGLLSLFFKKPLFIYCQLSSKVA